jgi:uncharacterized protein YjbJ (UPF0337 family)
MKFFISNKTFIMDELELRGRWHELKGKAKQTHGSLTDDDVRWEEGKDEEFFGRMQTKLGKTKDQVVDWIRSLGK